MEGSKLTISALARLLIVLFEMNYENVKYKIIDHENDTESNKTTIDSYYNRF